MSMRDYTTCLFLSKSYIRKNKLNNLKLKILSSWITEPVSAIGWNHINFKKIPAKLGFQPDSDSMWDSNAKSWPL